MLQRKRQPLVPGQAPLLVVTRCHAEWGDVVLCCVDVVVVTVVCS